MIRPAGGAAARRARVPAPPALAPRLTAFLLAALLFAAPLLAGCAPRLQPPGGQSRPPAIAGDVLVMEDGARLPLRVWGPPAADRPPRAVILALHGFNDYSAAFEGAAGAWAARGIVTYAYDQRGFGRAPHPGLWPGDQRLVADLRTAAALVAARHPKAPFYLLGESMGGAVVLAATADESAAGGLGTEVDGIILVAPAVWGREAQGPIQTAALWLAAHTVPWLTLTGEGLDIVPSDNIEMLRALGRDPLVIKETRVDAIYGLVGLMDRAWDAAPGLDGPTLVLYGAREEVLPEGAVLDWLRRLPPAGAAAAGAERQIGVYRNGYHMLLRDLQAEVVMNDVAHWIADPAAPLPSDADQVAAALLAGGAEDFAAVRAGRATPVVAGAAEAGAEAAAIGPAAIGPPAIGSAGAGGAE